MHSGEAQTRQNQTEAQSRSNRSKKRPEEAEMFGYVVTHMGLGSASIQARGYKQGSK